MSKIFAEIKRIVDEDISSRMTQIDVINEAITNAIHAGATEITCELGSSDNPIVDGESIVTAKKVNTIRIIDNGSGLNNANFESFCKYRSDYKKDLGCKGVGRFVYLKVYEFASFKSLLQLEQEERTFRFDLNFDSDNVSKKSTIVSNNYTEVFFSTLSVNYLNPTKQIDRRIDLNLEKIKEDVLINLVPTLFFYKKQEKKVQIKIMDSTTSEFQIITPDDVPDFKEIPFEVKERTGVKTKFLLNYFIANESGKLHAFYCANNRSVRSFSDSDFNFTLPNGYSGFMLCESQYFDSHVNNERNNFEIMPKRTDLFSTLSWEMINVELKVVLTKLIKEGIPETEKLNKDKIQEIQEERPYLVNFIAEEDLEIAGFLEKKKIIDNAKKRFDTAKEKVLTSAGKDEYTDAELNEAIQLAQNELVSYVHDRVQVIDRLKTLIDKKERVEQVIHNLFMEMRTEDDYYAVGKNNLWLLDDRYTTYSYAASDKRIREVLKGIDESNGDTEILDDKPDLSLFFSHNPIKPERLKSVMVEIKPFDYASKPDRKKFAGIQQLLDYVEAFQVKEKIEEVSAFLITEIDDKLEKRLRGDDYTPLFSTESPIFHRFYKETGISIFVISASTLIKDAEARNKVFLDIIRNQSRIQDMLK
jgi:hypothetical protein